MKKKNLIIAGSVVAACVVLGIGIWIYKGQNNDTGNVVYVNTVESILNIGSGNGMQNRYQGVVESQEDWKLERTENQVIEEFLVKEGDEVQEGTPLLRYNVENTQAELSQAKLDLERIDNDIANSKEQIKTLEAEKKNASSDSKLDYTIRIQTAQTEIKKNEYEKKSKAAAVAKLEGAVNNSTVTSKIAGVVKKINKGDSPVMDGSNDNSVITILKTGDLRIKGSVNEQNMGALMEGAELIIHSRVDNEKTWKGKITKIDRESPLSSNNNNGMMMGMGGSENNTQSSNYPFYVELEGSEGLMLGQHVYMEMDMGQEEKKEGLWIDSYFIVDVDSKPYVWASNKRNKLEKRYITLGEFDENLQKYEIKDGLKDEDMITFPEEGLEEGMTTQQSETGQLGQSNPEMPEDGMMEDGMMPEGGMEGEMIEGGSQEPMPEGAVDGSVTIEEGEAPSGGSVTEIPSSDAKMEKSVTDGGVG